MGFAGQVFAARVAVGLAMPSPKAFSQAGQVIGGFASKMYKKLNKESMGSARANLASQQKNLDAAQNKLKNHVKNQGSFIDAGTRGQLSKIKKLYGTIGKAAMASTGAMKGLKTTMGSGKTAGKLFKNLSKDMKDGNDYAKMMKNFSKLQKEERAEIFATFEARKKAFSRLINTSKKRKALGDERVQEIRDEMAILQSQEDEFKGFDKARNSADDKYNRKKRKHLEEVKTGTEAVTKAQKALENQEKEQIVVQEHLIRSTNDFAVSLKQNFVDAVRESVSVLTALYYKLEQNSSQLIEFERELMNANSVFRVTNDELFSVGNQVVQFGQEFGLEMQNGATGLYQLASAGLSAADAMQVLNDTLKLSMAVQGDHNTISKLVTQTLFGFEMEMNQAGLVADKFAYAIQKSLIEYQDLASAVKFALPFFTSTGQSIDQLLGALQVLTNRALEAGIAGRGLRQGVAELAESIGDATANFHALGVEVVDAEGNMLQLTEIAANFHDVLDEGVINDTELLTILIQDLNVRGATAFVHLVQASDEFTEAVEATANAGGELDEMIKIQNMSISSQIQILRNNVAMMSLYQDANYIGTGYLNAFHEAVSKMTQSMRGLLVTTEGGTYQLTAFGKSLETLAIKGIKELQGILDNVIPLTEKFLELTKVGIQLLKVYLIPVKMIVKALQVMGPTMTKMLISFHLLNKIMPISTAVSYAYNLANLRGTVVTNAMVAAKVKDNMVTTAQKNALISLFAIQKLINKEMWRGVAVKIYDLTLGKLRLILENRIIATDTFGLGVTNAKIAGWFIRDRLQSKNIAGLIWENILNLKKNVIDLISLKLTTFTNLLQARRLALDKTGLTIKYTQLGLLEKGVFWSIKQYYLDTRKYIMDSIQLKLDKIKVWYKNHEISLGIKQYMVVKLQVALRKISVMLGYQERFLGKEKYLLGNMTLAQSFKELAVQANKVFWKRIENIQDAISNKLQAIKLWYQKQTIAADIYANAISKIKAIQKAIINTLNKWEVYWDYQTIASKKLLTAGVILEIQVNRISIASSIKHLAIQIQTVIWEKLGYVQKLLTTKAAWGEIFAKITGNSVGLVENIQMKESIFLRMWKSTETIRGTLWTWADNAAQAFSNALAAIGGAIMYTLTIPGKIYKTAVTTLESIADWWNTTAVGANTLAKVGNFLVTVAAGAATVIMVVILGVVTLATWAWNIALWANPVGLIVLGVIALVVGLVMLVRHLSDGADMWTVFGMIAKHTMMAILWPFKKIWQGIVAVGNAVYGVLEGPLFKLGLFLTHFFKFIMYYVKKIGAWFMEKIINPAIAGFKWLYGIIKRWLIDPIIGFFVKIKEGLERLRNPLFTIGEFLMKHIFDPVLNAIGKIWSFMKKILGGIKKVGGAFLGKVMDHLGFAEGGYVNPMAEGGRTRARGPYLVGEKGPELFMPQGPGKIIPNKDLNTQRVKNMISKFEGDAGAIADKAFQRISANISVDSLEVRKANLRESRIGVDTFGGNI